VIQIGRRGLISDPAQISEFRAEFRVRHCIRLPQLLEPALLEFVQRRLEQTQWKTKIHDDDIGEEYVTHDRELLAVLHFVSNALKFREAIHEIAGCCPLRLFRGRVYQMNPATGHHDNWHDDNCDSRLVGMSINLSRRDYRGGLFQLRDRQSGSMLVQIANTGLGDALIFRISSELEHRISDVEGDEPKTAFAGWFKSDGPDLLSDLLRHSRTPGVP
jgi:hypothetical protein